MVQISTVKTLFWTTTIPSRDPRLLLPTLCSSKLAQLSPLSTRVTPPSTHSPTVPLEKRVQGTSSLSDPSSLTSTHLLLLHPPTRTLDLSTTCMNLTKDWVTRQHSTLSFHPLSSLPAPSGRSSDQVNEPSDQRVNEGTRPN